VDYREIKDSLQEGTKVIYCGQVDELLNYELGVLPWRSLKFEEEKTKDGLGEAVINEADKEVPFTRAHDYKYYQVDQPEVIAQKMSIVAREYPADFEKGGEAYYPVDNEKSRKLYDRYVELCKEKHPNMILGGRLGAYKYWDMDVAIKNALELVKTLEDR
jgi:UDP-galactopyranose mutase